MLSQDELLADLTPPQREAATHTDGPLLIIAGAGSGKTRVLTRRVAYLLSLGIPPANVLAITFTNKAAGEMKERVGHLLGRPIKDIGRVDQYHPTICTFHSLCVRILRHFGQRMGVPNNFTIFDSADQTKLVKEALKLLDINSQNFTPGQIHSSISNLKNQLITSDDYARTAASFYDKTVARVYSKYQKLLEANNGLDFDDLMLRVVLGFKQFPDVLAELQERYPYILIDEYQDTNHAQYILAHAMAQKYRNICVVGDPDQSIYAWRGANIQNILDFEKDYPDARVVRLEQNYRSTKTILALASQLIARNSQRKDKALWTENVQGERAKFFLCQNEEDEAVTIIDQFKQLNAGGTPWSDMAVFFRMNSLSRVMEEKLVANRIPYQVARGTEFYNRKEIKDVLAYLRVLANPSDEVSLARVVNTPTRGIGDESIRKMQLYSVGQGTTLFGALEQARFVPGLSARAANSTASFVQLIRHLRENVSGSPGDAADGMFAEVRKGTIQSIMEAVVAKSGMLTSLEKSTDPDKPELANVKELINSAATYDQDNPEGTLDEYLSQISLMSDADKVQGAGGAVTLMTLHAAKGLEFPVVAMIGLEEGVLPHSRARNSPDELEEERRLCFVGITRAQKQLFLSRAYARTLMGRRERTVPSPFLKEMPDEHIETIDRMDSGFTANGLGSNRSGFR
ncbi:MAG TPA: UvrD-helicase domain-containing protein, partial [Tepidisphaeraceae bacterium]